MGAKYTTNQTFSGYNSSPPADDGSQVASNLITWAKHKTKLADPIKTEATNIDNDLVAAFDYTPRRITTSDTVVAGDHERIVEIAPTATTSVVVTLPDASTLGTLFRTYIKNSSAHSQSIARATGADTIDGSAADITIPAKAAYLIQTNNNASSVADGFLIAGSFPLAIHLLTEETAPAVSDLVGFYDLSATANKKLELGKLISTLAASQAEQETGTATNKIVSPGRQHFHPSALKAWVKFDSGVNIAASYNITSVTDTGVGNWTINIATDFSSANFFGGGMAGRNSGSGPLMLNTSAAAAAGTFTMTLTDVTSTLRDPDTPNEIYVAFAGDQ